MSSPKKTIHINNRRYDASSGQSLEEGQEFIDEYKRLFGSDDRQSGSRVKPKKSKARLNKQRPTPDGFRRKPERSNTLMRPSVKKPKTIKPTEPPEEPIKPVSLATPTKERVNRAKSVVKSSKISKFHRHAVRASSVPTRVEKLEVKEPVVHKPAKPAESAGDWPVIDKFEQAIADATSHLEEFVEDAASSKRNRKFAFVTASFIALLVIGFGAFQAVPLAKVKLAGNKAGFSPSLPSYSPSGFGLTGSVGASSGEVALSYKSRTDDKGFKITQAPSEWNSESLINNFLTANGKQYQTVENDGKTIYTYDNSNATWVDGGIWFKLESNANLTSDQLIKIAQGL